MRTRNAMKIKNKVDSGPLARAMHAAGHNNN
jgi:hypothetical protein